MSVDDDEEVMRLRFTLNYAFTISKSESYVLGGVGVVIQNSSFKHARGGVVF